MHLNFHTGAKDAFSRHLKVFSVALLGLVLGLLALQINPTHAQNCTSEPVEAGYRDANFGNAPYIKPTAEKPENKLWWNDGLWWGSLWDADSSTYRIHKFDLANQCWQSVGPNLDDRAKSLADVLWDGEKLYVASHIREGADAPARLYRFSYDSVSQTYSLDAGFPVDINQDQSETLTLTKDSNGKLWVTWTKNSTVMVNRTVGDDLTWGTPFELPVGGTNIDADDISAIIAYGGDKIGILWSNQNDEKMYFAGHLDSEPDTVWLALEEAFANSALGAVADDHINLKMTADNGGNIYAVTKTSLTSGSDPLIVLLKRDAVDGWSWYQVWTVDDGHTRPIVLVDEESRQLYVFAPQRTATPRPIYMKSTSLDSINFEPGLGTVFIKSDADVLINDPTSTRQNVNSTTGILVLASDEGTQYYFHNYLDLSSGTGNLPPVAVDDAVSTAEGVAVEIDVLANDTDPDGSLDPTTVAIDSLPANGLAVVDSVTGLVTYSPDSGFVGVDSFTYTVQDDSGAVSNIATVTVTVNGPNTPPIAVDDTASTTEGIAVTIDVLANDSDADGNLDPATVTLVSLPANGDALVDGVTGTVTFTPFTGFTGADSFSYTVSDDSGAVSNEAMVRITVNTATGGTFTFNPTGDASVNSSNSTANYGDRPSLALKLDTADFDSYLKFEVTGLSGPVVKATLRLFATDGSDDGGSVYAVGNEYAGTTDPWDETGITFDNAPPISGTALASAGAVSADTWVEFDVTAAIAADGTYSFALSNSSTDLVFYSSKEGSDLPELVVETSGGGSTNTPPLAVDDSAGTTEGVAVTIDVLANDSDADGSLVPASVTVVSAPANGSTAVDSSTGAITYTPNAGFAGNDTLGYTVQDDAGATSNEAMVVVTISAENSPPVAVDDSAGTT
ncbi:MAG: tandem-95 repeat protein, partial [Calditrichaeota bacterium]